MLTRSNLHEYQVRAVAHMTALARSVLWLFMGAGKTISTLTAIVDLFEQARIHGVLILAPRRVTESVWAQEAAKWTHTAGLSVCVLRGGNKRLLERELIRPHHVWVINYESLPWLAPVLNKLFLAHGRWLPFNMLVLDELTRVKNAEGRRVSLLYNADKNGVRLIDHFPYRVGLTGTPCPNGYWDLHGCFYAIDDGFALGRSQQIFKERYFGEDMSTGRRYLVEGAKEQIEARIAPITLNMNQEDYLELPPCVINDMLVELPPKTRIEYDRLENEMFAELDHGRLEVFNAASLTAKCRQIANGMVIDPETDSAHPVHDAKLEALDEIMEEAGGRPVLCSYVFRADMKRIQERYARRFKVAYLGPGVNETDGNKIILDWNDGRFDMLLTHHGSSGHGLNLQAGGHIIAWFGLDWPLEGYLQLNARLLRQGQTERVFVHRILARATIDDVVRDRLDTKSEDQDDLRAAIDALQRYRENRAARQAA